MPPCLIWVSIVVKAVCRGRKMRLGLSWACKETLCALLQKTAALELHVHKTVGNLLCDSSTSSPYQMWSCLSLSPPATAAGMITTAEMMGDGTRKGVLMVTSGPMTSGLTKSGPMTSPTTNGLATAEAGTTS